jgi:hypothetical protein
VIFFPDRVILEDVALVSFGTGINPAGFECVAILLKLVELLQLSSYRLGGIGVS